MAGGIEGFFFGWLIVTRVSLLELVEISLGEATCRGLTGDRETSRPSQPHSFQLFLRMYLAL